VLWHVTLSLTTSVVTGALENLEKSMSCPMQSPMMMFNSVPRWFRTMAWPTGLQPPSTVHATLFTSNPWLSKMRQRTRVSSRSPTQKATPILRIPICLENSMSSLTRGHLPCPSLPTTLAVSSTFFTNGSETRIFPASSRASLAWRLGQKGGVCSRSSHGACL